MVLFEEPEGTQGFDAGGELCGVGKFTGGERVLVDGDGGVGGLSGIGGGFRMVMRLRRCDQYEASRDAAKTCDLTLIRGAGSMVPFGPYRWKSLVLRG